VDGETQVRGRMQLGGNELLEFEQMRFDYIEQVLQIEEQCFSSPWSASAFMYEITYNNLAHYIVALKEDKIIGYAGMWVILSDAHITNIAVCPSQRGNKYGENIMLEMMARACFFGASKMTLEVRVSNTHARQLYRRLGFVDHGCRKKYYSDNNEDAIIMWRDHLEPGLAQEWTNIAK